MRCRDKKKNNLRKANAREKLYQCWSIDLKTRYEQIIQANKLRNKTNALVTSTRANYIKDNVEENVNKPRELWKLLNNQLGFGSKLKTV